MRVLATAGAPGGGIRTFLRYVYGNAAFADCTFDLMAPDTNGLYAFLKETIPEGRINLIPIDPKPARFVTQVRSQIAAGSYDLLHSHGFTAGLLSEVSRSFTGVRHLMTAHDVFLDAQFNKLSRRLMKAGMSVLFRRMDGIHTVTEDAQANFQSFFPSVEKDKFHCVLHGVDTGFFRRGSARPLKKELNLGPDVPLIGYFGRFMGQKGFRLLVDAVGEIAERGSFSKMPHVVSFGWNGFVREDYEYLTSKGLGNLFHQLPQTDSMPEAVKGVDLVAMPSRWEACGLLAMEVLAAGKPIVGSDCIGLREVLQNSPAKQFRTGDASDLARVITSDLLNLESRGVEFVNYQSVAVERFDVERAAAELRHVFSKVAR